MKHIIHSFSNIPIAIEYYIGVNKRENTYIFDLASIYDIWFHAEEYPSCHVIARVPGKSINLSKKQKSTIIKMGCQLCKKHSSYLKDRLQISICYTEVKYVEKSEITGTINTKHLRSYTV